MKLNRNYLSDREYNIVKAFIQPFEKIEEIDNLVCSDLCLSSPELDEYTESPHNIPRTYTYKGHQYENQALHNAAESGGIITRYYEDERYARSYCVYSYGSGIIIIFDKEDKTYGIFVLREDDGNWFVTRTDREVGFSGFYKKNEFITALSEALSIFNNNFNEE